MRARLAVRTLLSAGALVVVSACGGEPDETTVTTGGATSKAEQDTGSDADAASFCSDMDEVFRGLETSAEREDVAAGDPRAVRDVLGGLTDQLAAMEPPVELDGQFSAVVGAGQDAIEQTEGAVPVSPEGLAAWQGAFDDYSARSAPPMDDIMEYAQDKCSVSPPSTS
ncbi:MULTISPECIES: hypothetical protein [unclassified Modestobacter]|uniref:hypothetical protein n=1 Tax=unclassified Modestobacter TaxID=2643866 RepID=UPI0022AA033E|nr:MULTISPECIES: hypothetical protein [unclassified Modestobacter]MCZ2823885.1 hypothetical protein [Modestobacter sp. VKM Ac-2981]MCZ2852130.1 hypothetical protein [Modestobacter sp. VKM Ac-2982]